MGGVHGGCSHKSRILCPAFGDDVMGMVKRVRWMRVLTDDSPNTFSMKYSSISAVASLALVASVALTPSFAQGEEGGYVYNRGEARFQDNVYNFLKHFSYDQYYWCQDYLFTTSNNSFVDNMDFAYYSGHGNNFYLGMGPGTSGGDVSIGSSTKWGDRDLEFIVFQSCQVVPSPIDRADWYQNWVGNNDTFQGLHQAIGYRTNSYSGNGISNNYGGRISSNQRCWQAWFAAVDDERSWFRGASYPGYASVVLYPGLDNDRYYSPGGDPPAGHSNLRIYYQY